MRDLTAVVGQMLAVVPVTETGLRARLDRAVKRIAYRAPEAMVLSWREVAEILEAEVGQPDCAWKLEVAAIFNGMGASSNA